MAISPSDVTGVILCGGRSSRMGEDKALLNYKGESFLSHACHSLSFCHDIIIASGERDYSHLGCKCISTEDIYKGKGPLAGIHAALKLCVTEYAFVLSVDLPLFTSSLGLGLLGEMDSSRDAVVPRTPDGRIHPLCAIYRTTVACTAERMLMENRLRVRDLLENIKTYFHDVGNVQDVINVNTKDDYKNLNL